MSSWEAIGWKTRLNWNSTSAFGASVWVSTAIAQVRPSGPKSTACVSGSTSNSFSLKGRKRATTWIVSEVASAVAAAGASSVPNGATRGGVRTPVFSSRPRTLKSVLAVLFWDRPTALQLLLRPPMPPRLERRLPLLPLLLGRIFILRRSLHSIRWLEASSRSRPCVSHTSCSHSWQTFGPATPRACLTKASNCSSNGGNLLGMAMFASIKELQLELLSDLGMLSSA
mmetsp:Transcript_81547/g.149231  ORF Transcript_81547/g.149231 Transcript_81547/m.149231 type:complete len:227 (+) Transcript_81547:1842-2522(+)